MSTSVLNFRSINNANVTSKSQNFNKNRVEIQKVKRVLFGPVDHVKTQKFLEDELEKIATHQSELWNFDFKNGKVLNANGVYDWRPIITPQQRKIQRKMRDFQHDETEDLYAKFSERAEINQDAVKMMMPKKKSKVKASKPSSPQRLITDFMQVTKRPLNNEYGNKKDCPVPMKIARLSEMS